MSKHKRAGDKRNEVGKAGSAPSVTENERAQGKCKEKERDLPKVNKSEVGDRSGRPLH